MCGILSVKIIQYHQIVIQCLKLRCDALLNKTFKRKFGYISGYLGAFL